MRRSHFFAAKWLYLVLGPCFPIGGLAIGSAPVSAVAIDRAMPAYCGIYSLYGALKSEGIACDFQHLVRPEIVTSRFGSDLESLKRTAEEYGAFAVARDNLTTVDLEAASCPVILHVSDERNIGVYNHWILYLGTENGLARVVDAPHDLERVPYAELLTRWDSVGLFVSRKPIDFTEAYVRQGLTTSAIMCTAGLLGLMAWTGLSLHRRIAPPLRAIALVGLSAALALAFHVGTRDGLLRNAAAVQLIQQSHVPIELTALTAKEVTELTVNQQAVVIDSRFDDAFEVGHIPGAINIPVTASKGERQAALNGVPTTIQLIVYCENDQCSYSDFVGRSLVIDGYPNVSLYPGGWREWSTNNK